MKQRFNRVIPVAIHLVTAVSRFEQVVTRWDGQICWFKAVDRRTDPEIAETLQTALN